jgi:hypothetical protein
MQSAPEIQVSFLDQSGEPMQIHEITTLSENFLKRLATDARNDAFKKATGVDWKTYKLAQTAGQSNTPATTTPAATTPAATTPAGFNASNVFNLPGMTQNAAAATKNAAVATQSPEQIRKAKQAVAAKAAQDQMAGKTTTAAQPTAITPSAAAPAAPAQPTATTQPAAPNFTQTNKVPYQQATMNTPVAKVPATPKPSVATASTTAPQLPEQIRKAKQAVAAKAALV